MSTIQDNDKPSIDQLESRVKYLEQINRLTLDALEQAAQLGDFQTSLNKMDSAMAILRETHKRIRSLIKFEAEAFYLVNEEDSEFYLAECKPEGIESFIKSEVESLIDNGSFAWAIREKRPIFVPTSQHSKKLLLHVLTTASRVRGMFIGVLTYGEMDVPMVSLSLMSTILLHSANALESFELYSIIKTINKNLENTVEERTKELQRSQEQLRHVQKMEAIGRLAGGVAHDFNNLLTTITLAAEIGQQNTASVPEVKSYFKEILSATERASDLTRQLLAMSRKQVIAPRVLDVNVVIRDISRMLSRLITEGIELILETGPNLPAIKADSGQLEQVLINLAVNARDAIVEAKDPAERKITIHVCHVWLGESEVQQKIVCREGHYIAIRCTDTGVGMDSDTIQKVFEPFFTTKKEGKGTGLGLATVYGIVTQNEGGITLKSELGQGTTFIVYWPCYESIKPDEAPRLPDKTLEPGKETILLVEDDEDIRNCVEDLLKALGYTIITAANGKIALEKVEKYPDQLHLLLTDITMPIMDGKHLALSLKKNIPNIKVIFTSGYTGDIDNLEDFPLSHFRFINKPYSVSQITHLIRQMLDEE